MAHPLVTQLRFTRDKFLIGLEGVSEQEALRRFGTMNSIGWIVGHMAHYEQIFWLWIAQGKQIAPELEQFATGQPASTPAFDQTLATWRAVVAEADAYLTALSQDDVRSQPTRPDGKLHRETTGTMLLRAIYHYWFHLGEMQAIRQLLGHTQLPGFVGSMPESAYYRAES